MPLNEESFMAPAPENKLLELLKEKKILIAGVIAVIVLIAVAYFFVLPLLSQKNSNVILSLKDQEGTILPSTTVSIKVNETVKNFSSDLKGLIPLTVPLNAKISVSAELDGFEKVNQSLTASNAEMSKTITFYKISKLLSKTIVLQNLAGEMINKEGKINFSCSNSKITAPQPIDTTTSGAIRVTPPEGCGDLIAEVIVKGFASKDSVKIVNATEVIELSAEKPKTGTIKISVKNKASEALNGITVKLFADSGVINSVISNTGIAEFNEVEVGEYFVLTESNPDYVSGRTEKFQVKENEVTEKNLVLEKERTATLEFEVTDKNSQAKISNAKVRIELQEKKFLEEKNSDKDGKVVFTLFDVGKFKVTVLHEEFLFDEKEIQVNKGENKEKISLEKLSPENSGRVLVTVKDEDNEVVENARVNILDAKTKFLYPLPKVYFTNAEGKVEFSGVKEGKYFVRVSKARTEADSKALNVSKRGITEYEIKMVIGEGVVSIKAVDADKAPVPNASAEFFDEKGKSLGKIDLGPEAERDFTTKADKKVFIRVSASGYSSYVTLLHEVIQNRKINVLAQLEKTIQGTKPSIDFIGLFNSTDSDKRIEKLEAGNAYIAKFQLKIPKGLKLKNAGVFVKTGEDSLVQNDNIFIKAINAPNSSKIRGTTFNEPKGYAIDSQNLTSENAKWVQIILQDPEEGIYNIAVELSVKIRTVPGERLSINYRAFAENDARETLRDPEDKELGLAENSANKEGLYANATILTYLEGQKEECTEEFCYGGVTLEESVSRLTLRQQPFEVFVFSENKLFFYLINNSAKDYLDPEIRFKSLDKAIKITSYKITDASAKQVSKNNQELFEFNEKLGNFSKNRAIKGEIDLQALDPEEKELKLQIVNKGNIVFEREIKFNAKVSNKLTIKSSPTFLPAFKKNVLNVELIDEQELGLSNTKVKFKLISPERIERFIGSELTDGLGKAVFKIGNLSPQSKLKIEVEKAGYQFTPVLVPVELDLVDITPSEVSLALESLGMRRKEKTVEALNKIDLPLQITDARLIGVFRQVDVTAMEGHLKNNVVGKILSPGIPEKIKPLIEVSISEGLQEDLESASYVGEILLVFSNKTIGKQWLKRIPFKLDLGLGGEINNAPCIFFDTSEKIEKTILQSSFEEKFTIVNRCKNTAGNSKLQNLKAKINWTGKDGPIGIVSLEVTETATQNKVFNPLIEGEEIIFAAPFRNESGLDSSSYSAILSFTPNEDTINKKAEFQVEFFGEALTDQGKEIIRSKPTPLTVKLLNTNLQNCIKFDTEEQRGRVLLKPDANEAIFKVDSSECKNVELELKICGGDSDKCRGNAVDGGIKVAPWSYGKILEKEVSFKVSRPTVEFVPGIYGIEVFARPVQKSGGTPPWQLIGVIDAILDVKKEDTDKYLNLEKYEFTLVNPTKKDETALFNERLMENVDVTADYCAWDKAKRYANTFVKIGEWFDELNESPTGWIMFIAEIGIAAIVIDVVLDLLDQIFGTDWADGFSKILGKLEILDDCEDRDHTGTLQDYVLNLVENGGSTKLVSLEGRVKSKPVIGPAGEARISRPNDFPLEKLGIELENKSLEEGLIHYDILEISGTEHVRGARPYSGGAHLKCRDGFGPFNVRGACGGYSTRTKTEKFHVRINTISPTPKLREIRLNEISCIGDGKQGKTGKDALPKVKLNWSWDEKTQNGISINECDANNEKAVYCDATQFSIMFAKRLNAISDFLEKNKNNLTCPTDSTSKTEEKNNSKKESKPVFLTKEKFGATEFETIFKGVENNLIVRVKYENDLKQKIDLNAVITLNKLIIEAGEEREVSKCKKDLSVNSKDFGVIECQFNDLAKDEYFVSLSTESQNKADLDDWNPKENIIVISEPTRLQGCWLPKTTAPLGGEPTLIKFLENSSNITYTADINSKEQLTNMLHFNALLMRDGFSSDFRQDFVNYYKNQSFMNAYPWFFNNTGGRNIEKYFSDQDRMRFSRKYTPSNKLDKPGIYEIQISILFDNEWSLFTNSGNPNARIGVTFNHLQLPKPNSVLYSMPLNGFVGKEGQTLNRQGYGTQFDVVQDEVKLSEGFEIVKTLKDSSSSALTKVKVERKNDLQSLNTNPKFRGNLLTINKVNENVNELLFSPNYATPVLMKFNQDKTEKPFTMHYGVTEGTQLVNTGANLTYWNAAVNCFDFGGEPLVKRFKVAPDRASKPEDGLPNHENIYALQWLKAVKGGNIFLQTIYFVPTIGNYNLKAVSPLSNILFYSPEKPTGSQTIELSGISGMNLNSKGRTEVVDSLQDIFSLVESGDVCVGNNGESFYWNSQKLYTFKNPQANIIDINSIAFEKEQRKECILN